MLKYLRYLLLAMGALLLPVAVSSCAPQDAEQGAQSDAGEAADGDANDGDDEGDDN